jgi:hypothetical protein
MLKLLSYLILPAIIGVFISINRIREERFRRKTSERKLEEFTREKDEK